MKTFLTEGNLWENFPRELEANGEDRVYLQRQADIFLAQTGPAVTDKNRPSPRGDGHDYVSQAPYWWPNPATTDGLPYLKRDGEVNPEIELSDRARLETFRRGISSLVLRSQLPEGQAYAEQAGKYLRRWFLDPETRMNPHLQFGQFIPGICEGRGIGIIETQIFCFTLDEIAHLAPGRFWTEVDRRGLKNWFEAYLEWLLESEHGKTESREHNNHGTWYDAQIVCFALFCGRPEIATRQLEQFTRKRIPEQIQPEGSQPHELARTLSMSYCTFNLVAFAFLARASRHLGLDLWKEEARIAAAVRWMLPYYLGGKEWPWTQQKPFNRSAAAFLTGLAAEGTDAEDLRVAAERLRQHPWNRISGWEIEVNQVRQRKGII